MDVKKIIMSVVAILASVLFGYAASKGIDAKGAVCGASPAVQSQSAQ